MGVLADADVAAASGVSGASGTSCTSGTSGIRPVKTPVRALPLALAGLAAGGVLVLMARRRYRSAGLRGAGSAPRKGRGL